MNIKEQLLKLLREHSDNCGDNLGRNGEYLDEQVNKIIDIVRTLE